MFVPVGNIIKGATHEQIMKWVGLSEKKLLETHSSNQEKKFGDDHSETNAGVTRLHIQKDTGKDTELRISYYADYPVQDRTDKG